MIALPDNWANYGKIIAAFQDKYKITVNSADLGTAVTLASTSHFAPYRMANWAQIPADNKESTGLYVNDYTGSMSIGYNSKKFTAPTSLDDLLGSQFKGAVAINGDPTQAGAAFAAVGLAAAQQGDGSLDNFQPGIDFFQKLKKAGNFLPLDPTEATIASGETPVVFDWSYNNLAVAANVEGWKVTTLPGVAYTSYYNRAINKDAPHPAAARLWQEFLYSPDTQNMFLQAGAYPVTLTALVDDKSVDNAALKTVGELPSELVTPTTEQSTAASALLAEKWAAAIG